MNAFLFRYRAGANADRFDLYRVFFNFFKQSPILGYGGNTLDTLNKKIGNYSLYGLEWAHTHNFFLEITLRYGLFAGIVFVIYLVKVFKRISDHDSLLFVVFLIFAALLQTFMQNFIYIFILISLVSFHDYREKC